MDCSATIYTLAVTIILQQFQYSQSIITLDNHQTLTSQLWEHGLREATYRVFAKEGWLEPGLKDELNIAPILGDNNPIVPFGDISMLARGQLYYKHGNLVFVKDKNLYDCENCEVLLPVTRYGQILLLWSVRRLRHRKPVDNFRYEVEYKISPIGNNHYIKNNGHFDYDIPGHIFLLNQDIKEGYNPTHHNKNGYLPYTNNNNNNNRYYLPPYTTTTSVYYYTKRTDRFTTTKKPDRQTSLEKEIELYNRLLNSLKNNQKGTVITRTTTTTLKPSASIGITKNIKNFTTQATTKIVTLGKVSTEETATNLPATIRSTPITTSTTRKVTTTVKKITPAKETTTAAEVITPKGITTTERTTTTNEVTTKTTATTTTTTAKPTTMITAKPTTTKKAIPTKEDFYIIFQTKKTKTPAPTTQKSTMVEQMQTPEYVATGTEGYSVYVTPVIPTKDVTNQIEVTIKTGSMSMTKTPSSISTPVSISMSSSSSSPTSSLTSVSSSVTTSISTLASTLPATTIVPSINIAVEGRKETIAATLQQPTLSSTTNEIMEVTSTYQKPSTSTQETLTSYGIKTASMYGKIFADEEKLSSLDKSTEKKPKISTAVSGREEMIAAIQDELAQTSADDEIMNATSTYHKPLSIQKTPTSRGEKTTSISTEIFPNDEKPTSLPRIMEKTTKSSKPSIGATPTSKYGKTIPVNEKSLPNNGKLSSAFRSLPTLVYVPTDLHPEVSTRTEVATSTTPDCGGVRTSKALTLIYKTPTQTAIKTSLSYGKTIRTSRMPTSVYETRNLMDRSSTQPGGKTASNRELDASSISVHKMTTLASKVSTSIASEKMKTNVMNETSEKLEETSTSIRKSESSEQTASTSIFVMLTSNRETPNLNGTSIYGNTVPNNKKLTSVPIDEASTQITPTSSYTPPISDHAKTISDHEKTISESGHSTSTSIYEMEVLVQKAPSLGFKTLISDDGQTHLDSNLEVSSTSNRNTSTSSDGASATVHNISAKTIPNIQTISHSMPTLPPLPPVPKTQSPIQKIPSQQTNLTKQATDRPKVQISYNQTIGLNHGGRKQHKQNTTLVDTVPILIQKVSTTSVYQVRTSEEGASTLNFEVQKSIDGKPEKNASISLDTTSFMNMTQVYEKPTEASGIVLRTEAPTSANEEIEMPKHDIDEKRFSTSVTPESAPPSMHKLKSSPFQEQSTLLYESTPIEVLTVPSPLFEHPGQMYQTPNSMGEAQPNPPTVNDTSSTSTLENSDLINELTPSTTISINKLTSPKSKISLDSKELTSIFHKPTVFHKKQKIVYSLRKYTASTQKPAKSRNITSVHKTSDSRDKPSTSSTTSASSLFRTPIPHVTTSVLNLKTSAPGLTTSTEQIESSSKKEVTNSPLGKKGGAAVNCTEIATSTEINLIDETTSIEKTPLFYETTSFERMSSSERPTSTIYIMETTIPTDSGILSGYDQISSDSGITPNPYETTSISNEQTESPSIFEPTLSSSIDVEQITSQAEPNVSTVKNSFINTRKYSIKHDTRLRSSTEKSSILTTSKRTYSSTKRTKKHKFTRPTKRTTSTRTGSPKTVNKINTTEKAAIRSTTKRNKFGITKKPTLSNKPIKGSEVTTIAENIEKITSKNIAITPSTLLTPFTQDGREILDDIFGKTLKTTIKSTTRDFKPSRKNAEIDDLFNELKRRRYMKGRKRIRNNNKFQKYQTTTQLSSENTSTEFGEYTTETLSNMEPSIKIIFSNFYEASTTKPDDSTELQSEIPTITNMLETTTSNELVEDNKFITTTTGNDIYTENTYYNIQEDGLSTDTNNDLKINSTTEDASVVLDNLVLSVLNNARVARYLNKKKRKGNRRKKKVIKVRNRHKMQ